MLKDDGQFFKALESGKTKPFSEVKAARRWTQATLGKARGHVCSFATKVTSFPGVWPPTKRRNVPFEREAS
jgi:hypothetical protein